MCMTDQIIIGTDQNIDLLDTSSPNSANFLDMIISEGLIPTAMRPTRITRTSATLIDNMYTNITSMHEVFSYLLTHDISDHLPIIIFIGKVTPSKRPPLVFESRNLDTVAIERIKTMLSVIDWDSLLLTDVDKQFERIRDTITECMDTCAPIVQKRIPHKMVIREPWRHPHLVSFYMQMTQRYFTLLPISVIYFPQ